ncbi:MAG: copper oxidase [Nitrosopumilales archaeon]|jgi:FtsP/CotA-like multicopper oxidase with cupredoxin domain|nr:multicopper oxidase domain-containing protein [Nitrososphaeraceae archaeon]MDW0155453.1 multicopper oxidase domain-containing protein [Nitrososphaeraceae archaeon]RPI85447.1 MAG: copper oxidase [Nitrosopumilales archaeon]
MFWQNAYFFALALSIILILPSVHFPFMNIPAHGQSTASPISQEEYDKIKNCTTNLSKKPTPVEYLTHFNCGHISKDESGKTVRQFTLIVEENQKIPITYEGHIFEGWTFNGTIPGPTIRVTEGDLVRIRVINSNENTHAHSLYSQPTHYVKNNAFTMTGQPGGTISPGRSFTYEFVAGPYGVYPYYCHVEPMADHINRGLYGMMIIDPKEPRPRMTEMAMLLNGYDLDLDLEGPITLPPVDSIDEVETNMPLNSSSNNNTNGGMNMSNMNDGSVPSIPESGNSKSASREKRVNEIYTVNGKAFDYMMNPIVLHTGELYRVYIVNMLEFDSVNSIHVHGAMFDYYSAGTNKTADYLTDIVTLTNGDRGIMEFTYDYPGTYMFHAHQTLFTDLGWMGLFDVRGPPVITPPSDAT